LRSAEAIASGVSWHWQLRVPLDPGVRVDVLALDPDEVSAAAIATLPARAVGSPSSPPRMVSACWSRRKTPPT